MGINREQICPQCGSEQTFTQAASTELNMGVKVKWRCDNCGFQTVEIGTKIDTTPAEG